MNLPTSQRPYSHRSGFTLIETLVYLALYALIIGGALTAVYSMIESSARNEATAMTEEEGDYLLAKIDMTIGDTASVRVPNSSGDTLSVVEFDGTAVTLNNCGTGLCRTEGTAVPQRLNNSDVSVSKLTFTYIHATSDGFDPARVSASFLLTATTSDGHTRSRDFSVSRFIHV
ncbi:MAG TPA: prepilin-type N-terminal cleavage/methylation domain-containing protein [Candidatus Paceibacterota bacterium]|nr:prepilin-type N-terminal cleavage/methylation domain-containing protein [Candidatus Paceibacterota bacterium]